MRLWVGIAGTHVRPRRERGASGQRHPEGGAEGVAGRAHRAAGARGRRDRELGGRAGCRVERGGKEGEEATEARDGPGMTEAEREAQAHRPARALDTGLGLEQN